MSDQPDLHETQSEKPVNLLTNQAQPWKQNRKKWREKTRLCQ